MISIDDSLEEVERVGEIRVLPLDELELNAN